MTQAANEARVAEVALSKGQRRFLKRRVCSWCDAPLTASCQAMYGDKCTERQMADRRTAALATYKPRQTREKLHAD